MPIILYYFMVIAISTGIFILDHYVFFKISILALYVIPIILSSFYLSRTTTYAIALLTWAAGLFTEQHTLANQDLIIRFLAIAVDFFIVSELGIRFSRSRKKIEEQHTLLVKKNQDLNLLILNTINALSSAIEAKDSYLRGHSLNVADLSRRIAKQLSLSSKTVNNIYLAGLLHDIGKIGVDEAILNKTSKLTAEEFGRIKEHSIFGSNIVSEIPEFVELVPLIQGHHERWDGSGYPDGLCADTIPLGARILSVADSYDAMTSDRAYRKSLKPNEAISELEHSSGTQFDPMIVNAFTSVLTKEIGFLCTNRPKVRVAKSVM